MQVIEREGRLPPVLFLQADNCGRENKNKTIVRLLGHLVHLGFIQEAHLYFLPVGHTHAEIDQRWSVLSRNLKSTDCLTLPFLMERTQECFVKIDSWVEQVEVTDVIDFDAMYQGKGYDFVGLGTARESNQQKRRLHALRFRKYNGHAVVEYKEFDSPGEKWRGDWQTQEPLRIFKDDVDLSWPSVFPCADRRALENMETIAEKIEQMKSLYKVRV